MSVAALIPARQGSKGLPGKNIRPVCGHALIAYSVCAARQSATIDRVIVSTDSEQIAAIARAYGAEVPFLRPRELARDDSPDFGVIKHAVQWLHGEGTEPEFIVHLRPTTPLRDPRIIDAAVNAFVAASEASSLRSVHEAAESPFKWFLKQQDGCLTPFHDGSGTDYSDLPRQQAPKVFVPNGYVDVIRTSYMQRHDELHGSRILGFVTPPTIEIDSALEFDYVEYRVRSEGHPLLTSLNAAASQRGNRQQDVVQ